MNQDLFFVFDVFEKKFYFYFFLALCCDWAALHLLLSERPAPRLCLETELLGLNQPDLT